MTKLEAKEPCTGTEDRRHSLRVLPRILKLRHSKRSDGEPMVANWRPLSLVFAGQGVPSIWPRPADKILLGNGVEREGGRRQFEVVRRCVVLRPVKGSGNLPA